MSIRAYDDLILQSGIRKIYASPYFNVGDWSKGASTLHDACNTLLDRVLALLPALASSILDVGCGLGGSTQRIWELDNACHVVGINNSPTQIKWAGNICPAHFAVMDAASLAFRSGSFGAVISVEAAFHFNTREHFMHEAWRVLEESGTLIVTDMLVGTTEWVGADLIPRSNLLAGIYDYVELCERTGFAVNYLADITPHTWIPYADYLRQQAYANSLLTDEEKQGVSALGEYLLAIPITYLIAQLTKY